MQVNEERPIGRAAVFHEVGESLALETFFLPALEGHEAIARIRCATICGSDLHSYFGRRHAPVPSVLGHEMVADITAVGPAGVCDYRGRPLKPGDRVTWSMVWSCGECFYCEHGVRPKCERLQKFGHQAITAERALFGGLAEYCHLPERTAIFKVPDAVTDVVASPANCATATVAAVFRNADSVKGKAVIIHGAGMLGLTACAMAAAGGAAHVIALEPDQSRRTLAALFGATAIIDSNLPEEEIRGRIFSFTENRGADVGLEFSGYPDACESGLRLLRDGGQFVMAGATFPSRPMQLAADQLVRRLLKIVGVYNYQPEDLETALEFLAANQGRFPFERLVGKIFSLDEGNAAFAYAEQQRPPRVAVIP
jgi:putative phosphonate catabolism associated alcohol dehydrogenase